MLSKLPSCSLYSVPSNSLGSKIITLYISGVFFFCLVFVFFAFLQSFATTNIFIYKYLLYLCNIFFPLNIAFKVSFSGGCRVHLFLIAVPQGIHFLIDGHLVVFVLPVSSSADLYILVHIS